jgi:hypothetical protein
MVPAARVDWQSEAKSACLKSLSLYDAFQSAWLKSFSKVVLLTHGFKEI